MTVQLGDVTNGKRKTKSAFFVLTLATAEQVGTTQLFNLNQSNLKLLLPARYFTNGTYGIFVRIDGGNTAVAHRGFGRGGKQPEVRERSPQPPTNFCGFHTKKTLILAHFFIEKGHAVSAVTSIDNAKIFSQLTSESRPAG